MINRLFGGKFETSILLREQRGDQPSKNFTVTLFQLYAKDDING